MIDDLEPRENDSTGDVAAILRSGGDLLASVRPAKQAHGARQ